VPFKLSDMRGELAERGYLKQHSFEVQITVPPALSGPGNAFGAPSSIGSYSGREMLSTDVSRMLLLRADTCRLPGTLVGTQMVQRYGFGPIRKQAINAVFSDIAVSFIVDQSGLVQSFFYSWLNSIVNFGQSLGIGSVASAGGRLPSYEIDYPDQYTAPINIRQYDPTGRQIEQIDLTHAFPTMVADRPVGWGMINSVQRLVVSFTFQEWNMVLGAQQAVV